MVYPKFLNEGYVGTRNLRASLAQKYKYWRSEGYLVLDKNDPSENLPRKLRFKSLTTQVFLKKNACFFGKSFFF